MILEIVEDPFTGVALESLGGGSYEVVGCAGHWVVFLWGTGFGDGCGLDCQADFVVEAGPGLVGHICNHPFLEPRKLPLGPAMKKHQIPNPFKHIPPKVVVHVQVDRLRASSLPCAQFSIKLFYLPLELG